MQGQEEFMLISHRSESLIDRNTKLCNLYTLHFVGGDSIFDVSPCKDLYNKSFLEEEITNNLSNLHDTEVYRTLSDKLTFYEVRMEECLKKLYIPRLINSIEKIKKFKE